MLALDARPGARGIPEWVPDNIKRYIAHTEEGHSIRALARECGCHASTILRQVRKCEARREDLLVDLALSRMPADRGEQAGPASTKNRNTKARTQRAAEPLPDSRTMNQEAPRLLRRLNEPGACMAIAKDLKKAVVVRENQAGDTIRTAVAERVIAEAMALKDWIALDGDGRVKRYRITAAGRIALKCFLAEQEGRRAGFKKLKEEDNTGDNQSGPSGTRTRYGAAESPLLTLARRRDKGGKPFLSGDLVAAGERLREDFELGKVGVDGPQYWEDVMSSKSATDPTADELKAGGATAARARFRAALADLGPGLGDVVLRCCCYLEGMEAVERRMGWSARSGKIVFRIALTRLNRHYSQNAGTWSPLIG